MAFLLVFCFCFCSVLLFWGGFCFFLVVVFFFVFVLLLLLLGVFCKSSYHFLKITCSLGLSKLSQVKEEEKRKTKLWMTGSGFSPSILPPPPPSLYVCLSVCSSSLPTVPVPHSLFAVANLEAGWLVIDISRLSMFASSRSRSKKDRCS